MKKILGNFINSNGSSMVQVMVAGAVMLGAGVYVTKTLKSQESLSKTTVLRMAASKEVQEISEVLTDWEVCKTTFSQSGQLTNNKTFDRILTKGSNVIYQTGIGSQSGKITEMLLTNFTPGTGLRLNQSTLRVTMEFNERRGGGQDSFGGTRKSYKIPVYLITLDNVVQTCMSDSGEVINDAFREVCRQFEGTFNETSGACENIYGPNGVIRKYVSDYFCTATGTGCAHPYAGQVCEDTYGHNNFAVSNFDGGGSMRCVCMPIVCPPKENYCLGKDLGTNWCGTTCDKGTWDPTDYKPDPSSYCQGQTFTQTTSCGKTRSAVGTYVPADYGPSTSTVCNGQSFIQTNSCGHTRAATGTKTCP